MKHAQVYQHHVWAEHGWPYHKTHDMTFYQCIWRDMVFDQTLFSKCTFYQCHWQNCQFIATDWQRVMVFKGRWQAIGCEQNQFNDTTFQQVNWQQVNLVECDYVGVGFHQIALAKTGMQLDRCSECLFDHCDLGTLQEKANQPLDRLTVQPSSAEGESVDPLLPLQQKWEYQHGLSI